MSASSLNIESGVRELREQLEMAGTNLTSACALEISAKEVLFRLGTRELCCVI